MGLRIYEALEQGSEQWLAARCGMVTASIVGKLLTPNLQVANNDTSRGITHALVAERLTGHVDDVYVTADMERGSLDEPYARDIYSEHYEPVTEVGFMVRDFGGYSIGYSPDGLVNDDGLIEIKSRKQKVHLATILGGEVPAENMAQLQTGLLVSGRNWIEYVSYCGGMPLYTERIYPDLRWFRAIKAAAEAFERAATQAVANYAALTGDLPTTKRIDHHQHDEIRI